MIDAVWSGSDRDACLWTVQHREIGACWPFVWERLPYFIYGSYPIPQRWRVDVFFLMLAVGVVWLLWLKAPRRDLGAIYFFIVLPIVSYILLTGWSAIGLEPVDTVLWGGVLVTIVVAVGRHRVLAAARHRSCARPPLAHAGGADALCRSSSNSCAACL